MAFQINNIVLVGVGGTGMSALARLFLQLGMTNIVSIDVAHSQMTDELEMLGLTILYGQGVYDVKAHDVVIYSDIESIKQSPELQQSLAWQHKNLKHYHRPRTYNEFLAEISKLFITVAITGTNGKSSTTALALSLCEKLVPNFGLGIVGALLPEYDNSNIVINTSLLPHSGSNGDIHDLINQILTGKLADPTLVKKYYFILEACEHKAHMLMYDYDYLVITNIGYDHQDYYKTQRDYYDAFVTAIHQSKRAVIVPEGEQSVHKALEGSSLSGDMVHQAQQKIAYAPHRGGQFRYVFGKYWHINAGMVYTLVATITNDKKPKNIDHYLEVFPGLGRRMEYLGVTTKQAIIYTDYGHHPDAIGYALRSLRERYPHRKIVTYFEPHQAHRLLSLRGEFHEVFSLTDELMMYPIYHAREDFDDLKGLISTVFPGLRINSFDELHQYVAEMLGATLLTDEHDIHSSICKRDVDDVCVIFSAGKLDGVVRAISCIQKPKD